MIVAFSENSTGRFPMIVGETYLLFSDYSGNPMVISNCGNSDLISNSTNNLKIINELSGK